MKDLLSKVRNELAAWLLPMLPRDLQRKVGNPNRDWKHSDLRVVASLPKSETNLLIAPANFGGQGYQWARSAETLPGVSAANLAFWDPAAVIRGKSDFLVKPEVGRESHIWARRQKRAIEHSFSHVLVEAELPILGGLYGKDLVREITALQKAGIKVALVSHGSDVRLPSKHRSIEPGSPFHSPLDGRTDALEAKASRNLALMDQLGLPEFVSTPDLLQFRPDATWLPLVADPDMWTSVEPTRLNRETPVVLHVPGRRPALKGTDSITPAMRTLEKEGLIKYIQSEVVPHDQLPELYKKADIVVNQVGIGGYGTVSVEAMLAGRIVVTQVWESARNTIRAQTGHGLPIVEATRETLEESVRNIVTSKEEYADLGQRSRDFALEVHSRENAARILRSFLSIGN